VKRTLGGWLAWWIGVATAASIGVYAATAALVLWLDEVYESGEPDHEGFDSEDATEMTVQATLALLMSAPVGILLATLGARWLTRRATRRIDDVIATAARMSAEDLGRRLPLSDHDDELDELARALNALFARIEGGVAAQRQFAADASHELRSPLTVLASTLEVARRRPRSAEEWEGFADRALDEVRHMSGMVDALLLLARAGTLRRARVDLGEVSDAIRERCAGEVVIAAPDGMVVDGDADMLGIAIGNLVTNALAHSPPGSPVRVTVAGEADGVAVHVDDEGPGVPLADRGRIFDPFVRGTAPTADRVAGRAGLGLGLAIARRIVEGHEGRIDVGEAAGGGARFTIWLPGAAIDERADRRAIAAR